MTEIVAQIQPHYGVIYLVTNLVNGKVYIGQTTAPRPEHRWNQHKSAVDRSESEDLFRFGRAMKKYGSDNFSFEILQYCYNDQDDLNYWECHYCDKYYDYLDKGWENRNKEAGYNIREPGSHGKHTEETKEKLRIINTGKILSPEHCAKLSLAKKGVPIHTDKHKAHLSKLLKGVPLSKEHCEAISVGRSGIIFSENHCKNISISKSGENSHTAKLVWAQVKEIRKEYLSGVLPGELSKKYDLYKSNIMKIVFNKIWIDPNYDTTEAHKIALRNKKPDGERNSQAKLTLEQVKTIRTECDADPEILTCELVAAKYNVSKATISLILQNKTWKNENYVPLKRNSIGRYING